MADADDTAAPDEDLVLDVDAGLDEVLDLGAVAVDVVAELGEGLVPDVVVVDVDLDAAPVLGVEVADAALLAADEEDHSE